MLAAYSRDDADNVEIVTLGSDPGDFLQVQRALEPDEQDVRLGMDTYCLVTADARVLYGGVAECTVSDRVVHLVFTDEAVRTLGVPPEVTMVVEGEAWQQATGALVRMLG